MVSIICSLKQYRYMSSLVDSLTGAKDRSFARLRENKSLSKTQPSADAGKRIPGNM